MKIKGNFVLLYATQLVSGILMWFASQKWGFPGLGIGLIPYFIAMSVALFRHKTDEREMQLSHEINSYDSIGFGVIAGIIYIFFPDTNWFFALAASTSVVRGIVGVIMFSLR